MSGVAIDPRRTSRITDDEREEAPSPASLPGNITSTRVFDAGDTLGIYAEAYETLKDTTPHTCRR